MGIFKAPKGPSAEEIKAREDAAREEERQRQLEAEQAQERKRQLSLQKEEQRRQSFVGQFQGTGDTAQTGRQQLTGR